MKFKTISGLGIKLVPLLSAVLLCMGNLACSSSSDGSDPDAAVSEEAVANNSNSAGNGDPLANDANGGENANSGNLENANSGNLENVNNANLNPNENQAAEAAVPANNNAAGAELQGAAGENQAVVGEGNVAADPFAATAQNAGAGNSAAPADGGNAAVDPFAAQAGGEVAATNAVPPANTEVPVNSAPVEAAPTGAAPSVGGAVTSGSSIAGVVVPELGSKMAYHVQKGDTLALIAKKVYGQMGKWKELASGNKILNPNKIYSGDVIYYTLTEGSKAFAEQYEGSARQSVTVAGGDTLSSIAARVIGSEGAWRLLWKENSKIKNPNVIRVGQVLSFRSFGGGAAPAKAEEVSATSPEAAVEGDGVAASE